MAENRLQIASALTLSHGGTDMTFLNSLKNAELKAEQYIVWVGLG
jgi:hypothetical protein